MCGRQPLKNLKGYGLSSTNFTWSILEYFVPSAKHLWVTASAKSSNPEVDAYSEPCQISKTELFTEIVNDWKPLTVLQKISILDVWHCSEKATEIYVLQKSCSFIGEISTNISKNQCLILDKYLCRMWLIQLFFYKQSNI